MSFAISAAAATYPARPIRIVVASAPGSGPDIVARLNAAVIAALKIADLHERLVALGADPLGSTPQAFAAFIRDEFKKWGKAVKDSGARVE